MYFVLQGANFSKANLGQIEIELGSIGTGGTIDPNAKYTLTVNVNVEDATIKLTPEGGSTVTTNGTSGTIEVTYNTKVNVEVSKENYNSYNRELTITRNRELSVNLTPLISDGSGNEPETPVNPPSGTSTTYYFKDQSNIGYLNGGTYTESTKSATTNYIDISSKPKIGYFGRMGYVAGSTFHALEFYDANKTYLSSLSVLGDGKEMIVNLDLSESKYANAKYVRASVSQSSFTTEQFNSWYFVVGSFIEQESTPSLDVVTSMFPNLGYLGLDGNDVEATSNAYVTDYVSLSGKTNIVYKGRMGTIGLNMAFYDSSKKLISGLETIGNGEFITLNINLSDSKYSNAAYVKASISRGTLDETTWLSSSFKIS